MVDRFLWVVISVYSPYNYFYEKGSNDFDAVTVIKQILETEEGVELK